MKELTSFIFVLFIFVMIFGTCSGSIDENGCSVGGWENDNYILRWDQILE